MILSAPKFNLFRAKTEIMALFENTGKLST